MKTWFFSYSLTLYIKAVSNQLYTSLSFFKKPFLKGKTKGTKKQISDLQGWQWRKGLTTKENKGSFGKLELLYILIVVVE